MSHHPSVNRALAYCWRIRELLFQHDGGRADADALTDFRALTSAASRVADDPECAGMMRAADRYALDLFSESAHQNWATRQLSGRDFLRSRIFGLLDAFGDRMTYLDVVDQG
jgi:hypothetical protein